MIERNPEKVKQIMENEGWPKTSYTVLSTGALMMPQTNINWRRCGLLEIDRQFTSTGSFDISGNAISSLEGSPLTVNGDFNASDIFIRTLHYLPRVISETLILQNLTMLPIYEFRRILLSKIGGLVIDHPRGEKIHGILMGGRKGISILSMPSELIPGKIKELMILDDRR